MRPDARASALALLLCAALPVQGEDVEGCKDHPLFNRMPAYEIEGCEATEFDAMLFPAGPSVEDPATGVKAPKPMTIEGRVATVTYRVREGAMQASALQVQRNFEAAIKAAGGTPQGSYDTARGDTSDLFEGWDQNAVYSLKKGGREVWVHVLSAAWPGYKLRIAEREAMKQEIVANELLDKINKDGFVSLYINFDSGKAAIKPDSLPLLDQVAQMLKGATDLAGHTDNVGGEQANLKLSDERARAVVAALTQRGIAAARLAPKGYGQSAPVADNRSEDGRAKNRRVELVKK
jgi:OmpA-OmpF porin, OOP family